MTQFVYFLFITCALATSIYPPNANDERDREKIYNKTSMDKHTTKIDEKDVFHIIGDSYKSEIVNATSNPKPARRTFWAWLKGVFGIDQNPVMIDTRKHNGNKTKAERRYNEKANIKRYTVIGNSKDEDRTDVFKILKEPEFRAQVAHALVNSRRQFKNQSENQVYEILNNLTQAINDLNDNIKLQRSSAYLVMNVPVDSTKNLTNTRHKRDIGNVHNETNKSGRRSTDDIKYKLLGYFNDIFLEIDRDIQNLAPIKDDYFQNNAFKVGYLMANLDAIETNMTSIQREMVADSDEWSDLDMIEAFDVLKSQRSMISKLVNSIHFYVQRDTDRGDSNK